MNTFKYASHDTYVILSCLELNFEHNSIKIRGHTSFVCIAGLCYVLCYPLPDLSSIPVVSFNLSPI